MAVCMIPVEWNKRERKTMDMLGDTDERQGSFTKENETKQEDPQQTN